MRNLRFTGKNKGFAISMDSLFALFLLIAFVGIIGIGINESVKTENGRQPYLKQQADDVFNALDNSGALARKLANAELREGLLHNNLDPTDLGIYEQAKRLLPENTGLKIIVKEYRANDLDTCKAAYLIYPETVTIEEVFDTCFGTAHASIEYPSKLPTDRTLIHGKKIAVMRQPVSDKIGQGLCVLQENLEFKEKEKEFIVAMLQTKPVIDTNVVFDETEIVCGEAVEVTIKARSEEVDGNVNIRIPVPQGMEILNYENRCGVWDNAIEDFSFQLDNCAVCSNGDSTCYANEVLTFVDKNISKTGTEWWAAVIDVNMPCKSNIGYEENVTLPPVGTTMIERSSEIAVAWDGQDYTKNVCVGDELNCFDEVPLKYADLNVLFTAGAFTEDTVTLDLEIDNNGFLDIPVSATALQGLQVAFYQNDFDRHLTVNSIANAWIGEGVEETAVSTGTSDGNLFIGIPASVGSEICSPQDGCVASSSLWKLRLEDIELSGCLDDCNGTILVLVNGNANVNESLLHNVAEMHCLNESQLRFYTIDYYVWFK